MKRIIALLCAAVMAYSCSTVPTARLTFENTTDVDRVEEMVEVELATLKSSMGVMSDETFVVYSASGKEIPSQITYDGKLIFQVSVAPMSKSTYKIKVGTPAEYESKVYGRQFPERLDDFAWENDRIAYRVYGPASQVLDQKLYGYDVWTKSVTRMVLEERYKMDLDPVWRAKIAEVAKTDQAKADEMLRSVSFHVDHGTGMDAYNVGPTLGAGTLALMESGKILYPYCYKDYEILEMGPLRLTVKLTYNPLKVADRDDVVETRTLVVDAGTQFVKTKVSYSNIRKSTKVVAGIVMAGAKGKQAKVSKKEGFAAYADVDRLEEQGTIFVGTIFSAPARSAGIMPFVKDDPTYAGTGMTGHVSLIGEYIPN
ncbi:MAG: DUF4861 family protein, partial [Rikenellaceae bacterium]